MKYSEIADLLASIGVLSTGLASLITALKPKKEQPQPRSRTRRKRK